MTNTDEWKKHVADWRASGLGAEEFSQARGLSKARLWAWSSRLRKAERATAGVVQLARVVRQASPERNEGSVTVELHGARVLVRPGVDRAILATVLEAVAGLERPARGVGR
jgi:transposase